MGSGALLAILVALWFVVLVPMVVTRGDLATAPAEPMRVLRRRSDRGAKSESAMSRSEMSRTAKATGSGRASSVPSIPDHMRTQPIPPLPRRIPGATLMQERPTREKPAAPGKARTVTQPTDAESPARDRTPREFGIRARRRRMLVGLIALAGLWAVAAGFWQPVLWWPQIVLDLIVFSYLVFLRLEAQREQDRQERRRARAAGRAALPEDRTERSVRRHTQYQAQVTAATEHQPIALDDDDPSFAEMPTWNAPPAEPVVPEIPEMPDWSYRKAV